MPRLSFLLLIASGLYVSLAGCASRSVPDTDPPVVRYSADCPHIQCLAGRVIAESDPRLTAAERGHLWDEYGLRCSFEWVVPQTGFTYHELEVRPWQLWQAALARLEKRRLPSRKLPDLIAAMNEDPR